MTENVKNAVFIQVFSTPSAAPPAVTVEAATSHQAEAKPRAPGRTGFRHIGGYFDRNDVEKFEILRARFGLDNSKLIRLAIDELYAKHQNEARVWQDLKAREGHKNHNIEANGRQEVAVNVVDELGKAALKKRKV